MIRIVDILKRAGEWGEGRDREKEKNEEKAKREEKPPVKQTKKPLEKLPAKQPEQQPEKLLEKPIEVKKLAPPVINFTDQINNIYSEMMRRTNNILAQKQSNKQAVEEGRAVVLLIGKLVEQATLNSQELIKILNRQKPQDERYYKLMRFIINTIKLGIDTKYSQEKLNELAITVLVHKVQALWPDESAGVKALEAVMVCCAKYDEVAYDNIIRLAEIYESTVR
jgi:hypothetical protein